MQNSATKLKKVSLNETQKGKNLDGEHISRVVRFSSPDRTVQAVADRIWACNQYSNLYTAKDLHSETTGEMFDGKGQLWACHSRLCPTCTGKLSKRNRRIVRHVFDNEKLFVGEHWFFITYTQPDLSLLELDLLTIRSVMNEAWRSYSRSKFFAEISRGGFKSEEFTVGNFKQYHYHIHSLAICRNRITSNNFREIRRAWTDALEKSFRKHNLKFECNTSDGFAVVNVQKVYNKNRAVFELCKYVTKTTDWAKIPPAQLAHIATIKRFPRMFEVFGICKEKADEVRPKARTKPVETDEYVHTKKISVNSSELPSVENFDAGTVKNITVSGEVSNANAPPKKRATWRELCRILPRTEWLNHLEREILSCQEFRKGQLRATYAFATFRTLDNQEF